MTHRPISPIANVVTSPQTRRYFIADLHLDGTETARALKFRAFLTRLAGECQRGAVELYIIGDLFEFWYEYRQAIFDVYRADLDALTRAWRAGVKIFLFYGNRDFSYGKKITKLVGATVLGDGEQISLNDTRPVWLEHGDLLCTADRKYLRFRKVIRSRPVKAAFFLMPWAMAKRMIEKIRAKTLADKATKSSKEISIDLEAARARLEKKKCKVLICGHTHKPLSADLGAGFRLIVLPPWCDHAGGYVDDGSLRPFEAQ
jgi:UDP-2,3-diacylglucosamine hydrolase